jgi:hypothetical protein
VLFSGWGGYGSALRRRSATENTVATTKRLEGNGWVQMKQPIRNMRLLKDRFQFTTKNTNCLWLSPLEVGKPVSQLLADIVELRLAAALIRVLQFTYK